MPRRDDKKARGNQHSKGHARPRKWHLSQKQGHKNERMMKDAINPMYGRADSDRETAAKTTATHRETTADWQDCLRQLERAAPFVPRIGAGI